VSESTHLGRYVSEAVTLHQIQRIRRALAPFGWPQTFNLYSEGSRRDFQLFTEAGCNLHLSEDAFESFHNMVIADVLMTAPSTFSQVAGLLSTGLVLDCSTRSRRLSNHLQRNANRDISIKRIRRALLERTSWLERCAHFVRKHWQIMRQPQKAVCKRQAAGNAD
jgi:hypothetical protein